MAERPCDKEGSTKSQRKQWSVVWEHFEKKKRNCVCKHCGKTFAYHGGTSNLRSHLKNVHRTLWLANDEDEDSERIATKTKRIDIYVVSDLWKVCSKARSEAITNLVVDWISENSRPISVVEDAGLQQLFQYVEPAYRLPSCTQVASIVKNIIQVAKKL